MFKVLQKEHHDVLLLLAKRKDPSLSKWRTATRDDRKLRIWTCCICGESWEAAALSSYNHGMKHLKDRNLLPFI